MKLRADDVFFWIILTLQCALLVCVLVVAICLWHLLGGAA